MPRPLYVLYAIERFDHGRTAQSNDSHLAEIQPLFDRVTALLHACLKSMLQLDHATRSDRTVFQLACRFWNDIEATWLLIRHGFALNAAMTQRDAVECLALSEYLKNNNDAAGDWRRAMSHSERMRHSMSKYCLDLPQGQELYDYFQKLSSYSHPTALSEPLYSLPREVFGVRFSIGGRDMPWEVSSSASELTALAILFVQNLLDWYGPVLPLEDVVRDLHRLDEMWHQQTRPAIGPDSDSQPLLHEVAKVTQLDEHQVRQMFQVLDNCPDWEQYLRRLLPPDAIP